MAPMKTSSNNYSSSNYGEDMDRQASVLASCYIVDATGSLKGLHYCGQSGIPEVPNSGLPSPPSSPPLAAITSSNELALTPKPAKHNSSNGHNDNVISSSSRRRGATLRIREECERFFCETMKTVFHGEVSSVYNGSGLTGVYQQHQHNNDHRVQRHYVGSNSSSVSSADSGYFGSYGANPLSGKLSTPPDDFPSSEMTVGANIEIVAWMEIWDYQGGASFRAFIAEDIRGGEKSLFAFFDAGIIGRDLKQALVALIEVAETPLGCSQLVVCIDRSIEADEAKALKKGLQWAGFELTTLDYWAGDLDVTSKDWLFMGMEV